MAKRKPDTGAIYISPRLRASLEPVGRCALTVVTAPMGYGKTTAVNWFLGTQPPGCAIRISTPSPVRMRRHSAGCAGSCGGRSHGMCFWTICT